jgi:hypothetical protein
MDRLALIVPQQGKDVFYTVLAVTGLDGQWLENQSESPWDSGPRNSETVLVRVNSSLAVSQLN